MSSNTQPTSLNDLVQNYRHSLKSPFQWTSSHLDLIGCRFGDINTAPVNPQDASKENDNDEPSQAERYTDDLANRLQASTRIECVTGILSGTERPFDHPRIGPSFRFQSRAVHRPDYLIFFRWENADPKSQPPLASLGSAPPLVGYVHYSKINRDRFSYSKRKKLPFQLRDNWDDDPYFVCHLLSMAQLQDRLVPATSAKPIAYASRLLITHQFDHDFIHIYEAQFSRGLLDGLQDLKVGISPMTWPTIRRTRIPFKPYSTFSSRLIAELVGPVSTCEPSSRTDGETHESGSCKKRSHEQEDQETLKRQRISSES